MTKNSAKQCRVFAPAKLTLFLHITGKQQDSSHQIDSLVTFADIGDWITIEEHDSFAFEITGPFGSHFDQDDHNAYIDGQNLVTRAAKNLIQAADISANIKITLEKNIPLSAGLSGGSCDAAATLWGLNQFFNLDHNAAYLSPIMRNLGQDVAACYGSKPVMIGGEGEELLPAPDMPEMAALLISPTKPCPREDVLLKYQDNFQNNTRLPHHIKTTHELAELLNNCKNDLYPAASQVLPEVRNIIATLDAQQDCLLSRMNGSGASCYGLFKTHASARKAEDIIRKENPDWWVESGQINGLHRY